ncbi:MAG: zinc-binding dehydrogenase [Actinomycetota bacterium]
MRALVAAPSSASLVELRDVPDPEPDERQALIEVRAVSLNRGECVALRTAEDGWRPGWDLAGVVVRRAADGSGPREGARVVGWVNGGAWAEHAAVRTAHLAELPEPVSFETASTLPVAGLTALVGVEIAGDVAGDRVAITGANGGVGRFAIQIAKAAGAHVTAVVTAPNRAEGLSRLGADETAIGLDGEGEGFDLILESVGGRSLAAAMARVAELGTIVTFGNSSGETTEFDPRTFYRRGAPTMRGLFIVWELLHERVGSRQLGTLVDLVARGALRADIDLVKPWNEAGSAVEALLERRIAGKAVLTIS